ncbi:MAG: hypothetical protein IIV79_03070, partial [Clostridia bacterium]|nr:hypothetical protein [Clostridia bacterium]
NIAAYLNFARDSCRVRSPAKMQVIVGTMNPKHLADICAASDVTLTRSEWYALYLAAGHRLP